MSSPRPNVLYIAYWGACEPLGLSLVVPAIKRLAGLGVDLTLVTFEKSADLAQTQFVFEVRQDFERSGVRWIPLRYHKSPRIPATLFDIAHGVTRSIFTTRTGRFDIVHARTFVGGLIGLGLAPLTGAKFIYHNEGFYPDEQVDAGVWQEGSAVHRFARSLEVRMYRKANATIVLSSKAKVAIENLQEACVAKPPVIIVPSCVDTNHFRATDSRPTLCPKLRLVYSGSVGGRYLLDKMGRFVAVVMREWNGVHLDVLTRSDPEIVANTLKACGLTQDAFTVRRVPFSEMPLELSSMTAGLLFWPNGLSEHGTSPTKVGEYWAMGLPVITTPNVSDIDDIISREQVGVIVRGHSDEDYRAASRQLAELLKDPGLAARCRRAAEEHYALGPACERQYQLYLQLMVRSKGREGGN